MTSSKSNVSINRLLLVLAALLVVSGFGLRTATAERKRVVILPFDGEKAEKFHASMVKLVKKSHTVVSTEKWETTAEGMGAAKVNEKNIKKVAKKMKVDGVIEGTITKRRDEYMIKLKLRAGKDGAVVANASVKAEGTKLDGSAGKEIKDELVKAIDGLESADDDDDAKPAKKGKKDDDDAKPAKKGKKDDDDDAKPAKKGKKDDDDAKPAKKGKKDDDDEKPVAKKGKKDDDDKKGSKFGGGGMKDGKDANGKKDDDAKKDTKKDDDEASALKTKKDDDGDKPKKGKKVAKKDDGDEGGGEEIGKKGTPGAKMDSATALSAGNRAIDATLGVSLNARRLSWQADADLPSSADAGAGMGKPPNYKGVPAPGAVVDITAYPMAFGHSSTGITKDIGLNVMYDKALLISSEAGGEKLTTKASRFLVGPVFRYAFGKGPGAPVVGGSLRYGKQLFSIEGADLPNVNYSMIEPGVFFKMGFGKIEMNLALNYMLVSKSGDMEDMAQYGGDKMSGFDIAAGADYALTKSIFARALIKYESITHKFDGTGLLTTTRDSDPEQDVSGAKDAYIGAAITIGILY